MTKGDSTVTALFEVLSPGKTRLARRYFLRVTGDSTFQEAHTRTHIREDGEEGYRQVTPQSAVTCHPVPFLAPLDSKKRGDSTPRHAVTRAVTRPEVTPCP